MATPVYARSGRNPYYVLGQRGYLAPFIGEEPTPTSEGLGGEQTANVTTPVQAAFASPADWLNAEYGGGSQGATAGRTTQGYGPMGPDAARAAGLADTAVMGGFTGIAGVPGLAKLGMSLASRATGVPTGPLSLADFFSKLAGVPSVVNPYASLLTPESLREMGYYDPTRATREGWAEEATLGKISQDIDTSLNEADQRAAEVAAARDTGGQPGGPSVGDYGPSQSQHEAETGSGYDSGGRDAGSAGDAGTGTGGESGSGYVARGGVFRTKRPSRLNVTWGERGTGGETAIFIPKRMRHPGIQGKERNVVQALRREYSALQPRGFAKLRHGPRTARRRAA